MDLHSSVYNNQCLGSGRIRFFSPIRKYIQILKSGSEFILCFHFVIKVPTKIDNNFINKVIWNWLGLSVKNDFKKNNIIFDKGFFSDPGSDFFSNLDFSDPELVPRSWSWLGKNKKSDTDSAKRDPDLKHLVKHMNQLSCVFSQNDFLAVPEPPEASLKCSESKPRRHPLLSILYSMFALKIMNLT